MEQEDTFPSPDMIDVVVIGAGPAGMACALTLRTYTSCRVTVLEASNYTQERVGEHVSSALLPLLDYLQIKEAFLALEASLKSVAVRSLWGRTTTFEHPSLQHWSGDGYLLQRDLFDLLLASTVEERGGSVYLACRPEKIQAREDGQGWDLLVRHTSGKRLALQARFLVDASGRSACVARRLGVLSTRYDALIGASQFFQMEKSSSSAGTLLIESTQDGWWYSAPLPGNRLVATFMTDGSIWGGSMQPKSGRWQAFLDHAPQTAARVRSRAKMALADVTIRPAHSHLLNENAGAAWLAVGDAAASFDPLSSLGIGFALHSACHGALAIAACLTDKKTEALRVYSQAIKEQFASYLPVWRACYASETRWLDAPFWLKRRERSVSVPV